MECLKSLESLKIGKVKGKQVPSRLYIGNGNEWELYIPLKFLRKGSTVGSELRHWMWGTTRHLEQLMMLRGLRNVRDNHETHKTELPQVRTTKSNGVSS